MYLKGKIYYVKKLFMPMCIVLAVGTVYMPASAKAQGLSQVQTKVANINKFESITYNKIDFEVIDYDKAPKTLTKGMEYKV